MEKQNKKKFINTKGIALLLIIVSVLACFFGITTPLVSYAENVLYSPALTDLQKSDNFNLNDYPIVYDDYSLQLITVAEGIKNELYIYTYQPSTDPNMVATSINISTAKKTKDDYTNYSLKYLNHSGVFFKYKVEDFEVSTDVVRYYEITSIFRAWNKDIDSAVENNTTLEVSFPVGKQFIFTKMSDGISSLDVHDVELIKVTSKYVGFSRYLAGLNHWGTADLCDSHYIVFGTDKKINKLLEADVYFQTQTVVKGNVGAASTISYGDIIDNYSYMTDRTMACYESDYSGWFNSSYSWERIQKIDAFMESEDFENSYSMGLFNVDISNKLTDDAVSLMKDKQWVLRFFESSYVKAGAGAAEKWTIVSNVSLLRLKFQADGIIYDLGVIDNKQTGSEDPSNDLNYVFDFNEWWIVLLVGIVVIVLLIAFAPSILVGFFKFLFTVLKYIFKGLWWLITAPFSLFKKEK